MLVSVSALGFAIARHQTFTLSSLTLSSLFSLPLRLHPFYSTKNKTTAPMGANAQPQGRSFFLVQGAFVLWGSEARRRRTAKGERRKKEKSHSPFSFAFPLSFKTIPPRTRQACKWRPISSPFLLWVRCSWWSCSFWGREDQRITEGFLKESPQARPCSFSSQRKKSEREREQERRKKKEKGRKKKREISPPSSSSAKKNNLSLPSLSFHKFPTSSQARTPSPRVSRSPPSAAPRCPRAPSASPRATS